jgi:predicted peptidase
MISHDYYIAEGASAQPGKQVEQWLVDRSDRGRKLGVLLFLPQDYGRQAKRWPLMLFLHGAGERGRVLGAVKRHGPPKIVQSQPDFPFIVVSPQCPVNRWWVEPEILGMLMPLVDEVLRRYDVDESRIYLTGISMGGFGSWLLAAMHPERFAAVVPICGGGQPEHAERLKRVPIWAFHGARDDIVPADFSVHMVETLTRVGGNIRFTLYPDAYHDSWTRTYANPEVYDWMLEHATPR